MTRAPSEITFMSSSSTPCRAENVSWHMAARMPGTFVAATDAPTPLPQITMPRSHRPDATATATARAKSG